MLITEWKMEDALAVRYEEGMEKGIEKGIVKGIEKGIVKGMKKGIVKGMAKGKEESKEEIARNALAEGVSIEIVQKITGLDMATLKAF